MDLESTLIELLEEKQDELDAVEIDPSRISNIKINDEAIKGKEDLKQQFRFLIEIINDIIKYIDTVHIDKLCMIEYCSQILLLRASLQDIEIMLEEEPPLKLDPQE